MSKHILVCLPISAEQRTRIEAVQGFAYRFTTPDTATVEDALWADAVLGNLPVPLIRQNDHLEWFQSNTAGPNNYLEPGVLPEGCIVTNATGAYGLAISECMLAMWLKPAQGAAHLPGQPAGTPLGTHRPLCGQHCGQPGALRGHGRYRLELCPAGACAGC